MGKYLKTGIFSLGYTFLFVILPMIIWAIADGKNSESLLVFYVFVMFFTVGFTMFLVLFKNDTSGTDKRVMQKLEDMEVQNTAIAFSLSELKKEIRGGKNKSGQ